MTLDAAFLISFFAVFIRCTAMLLSSPLYGAVVPVQVRVFGGAVISLAVLPIVGGHIGPVPENIVDLIFLAGREAILGVTIGLCLQFMTAAIQIAGSFLDYQLGIGSAQLFNPNMNGSATPIGQFKLWLSLVLIFVLDAHHLMFQAFVKSFALPGFFGGDPGYFVAQVSALFGQLMMLSIQIAAPVVAVTVIIDVAAGIINKAVPQTQPFLLALPAKLALGMIALSVGLPSVAAGVNAGVRITFDHMGRLLGG